MLQSITTNASGERIDYWVVYDDQLNVINRFSPIEYRYDPRERPWFKEAQNSDQLVVTAPYVFFTTKEIGLTFAKRNQTSGAIVGVDATLAALSGVLQTLQPAPTTELVLMDANGYAIAYPDARRLIYADQSGHHRLTKIMELGVPALGQLALTSTPTNKLLPVLHSDNAWYGLKLPIGDDYNDWQMLFAMPERVLFAEVNEHLYKELVISAIIIGILVVAGAVIGHSIARPLLQLSNEVGALASYDFSRDIKVHSNIHEVQQLSQLISRMASAIRNFQSISKKLARAPDLDMTLDQISQHLIAITSAQTGAVFLFDESTQMLSLASHTELKTPAEMHCPDQQWQSIHETLQRCVREKPVNLFITPLLDRNEKILGALVLLLLDHSEEVDSALFQFIEEISGTAATAIAARHQFEAQQDLLDSIIKLLADAIDAKSPYTSGHCERVPVLAEMLADEAMATNHGPLKGFTLSTAERREFKTAAWLHDCGKLTSPEHIIDKATKLETIYNRIHEVRTRFEVLWRDADITYLKGTIAGHDPGQLAQTRQQRQ